MKPLACISLWAPWGNYCADGLKSVETRHWPTKFRGRLAIHQAKTTKALAEVNQHLRDAGRTDLIGTYPKQWKDWPLGCIVAVVEMVDCVPTEEILDRISLQERGFGNYLPGRFAWVFKDVKKLDPPILCKGQQGFWALSAEETAAVYKVLGMGACA